MMKRGKSGPFVGLHECLVAHIISYSSVGRSVGRGLPASSVVLAPCGVCRGAASREETGGRRQVETRHVGVVRIAEASAAVILVFARTNFIARRRSEKSSDMPSKAMNPAALRTAGNGRPAAVITSNGRKIPNI